MNEPLEVFTSPPAAVTLTTTVSAAHFMGLTLPDVINIATAIYLVLLVSHKGWQMYKEWKDGRTRDKRE